MIIQKKHEKYKIPLRQEVIDKILSAISDMPQITRKTISENTGYSLVTAGKFLEAVCNISLADKLPYTPRGGGRSCMHLVYSENVYFAVIDISTKIFSTTLANARGNTATQYCYIYNDSLKHEDNLRLFLSNSVMHMKNFNFEYSLCALITENPLSPCRHHIYSDTHIKRTCQISPENIVSEFFPNAPDIVLFPDRCIRQYILCSDAGRDTAYVSVGSTLCTLYVSDTKDLTVCKPWNYIINGKTLSEYIMSSSERNVIYSCVAKICNMLDCTFSPSNIIISSDTLALNGNFTEEIQGYLSGYGSKSKIHFCTSRSGEHISGAVFIMRSRLLGETILSSIK